MKTLNNKRASATKTYLLFTLLAIAVIGIVWAQAVPTQPSQVAVQGTQLMLEKRLPDGTLAAPKPYIVKGVVWDPAALVGTPSAGPGYGIRTTAAMQYASISDDPKWNLSGPFTLAVWVNMSSYPLAWWEGAFMAHDEGGGGLPKWIFTYDRGSSSLIWHLNGYGGNTTLAQARPLSLNTWYLVGISKDASNTYKFWVNGAQVGAAQTDATQIEDANSPLTIGFGEGGSTLDGYLAEPLIFNRELQAGDWTALYNGGTGAEGDTTKTPWNDGLIGGWHFDEGTGTTAADFSPSGLNGTLVNSPVWVTGQVTPVIGFPATLVNSPVWLWETGQVGGAGPVYGIRTTSAPSLQYASVADDAKWDFSGPFAMAVWVNMANYPRAWWQGAFMAHDGGSGGNPKWIFGYDGNSQKLIWHINGTNNVVLEQAVPLALDMWYLVGVSRDASNNYKFWVDGSQVGALQNNGARIDNADCPLTIGYGEEDSSFDGYLSEALIFDRELSGGDWTTLYNGGTGVKGDINLAPWNNGLIGGWHFDEGAGTTAADFSGSGSTGGSQPDLTPQIESIRDLRANTVRIIDPAVVTTALLDQLYNNSVMAIVTVANSREEIETQAHRDVVNAYKNHPAILMWNIGEEWNKDGDYMGYPSLAAAATAINNAAQSIKEGSDTMHPVSTAIYDGSVTDLLLLCPSIDVWGLNVYRGTSFGSLFGQWNQLTSTIPFYFSEMGMDPSLPADPAQLASTVVDLWSEIKPNLSARYITKQCVGGALRGFADLVDEQLQPNQAYGSLQQKYVSLETPEIASIEPASPLSGSGILIRGFEFGDQEFAGQVLVDNNPIIGYTSWSNTEVRLTLPPLDSGAHQMVLHSVVPGKINSDSNQYDFTVSINIASIDFTSRRPDETITINGIGFGAEQGTSTVKFDTTEAVINLNGWSDQSISCVIPQLPTSSYRVTVTTAGGTSNEYEFVVKNKPTIDPIIVGSFGDCAGAEAVISGTDFGASPTVYVGAVPATDYPARSDTEITFIIPDGAESGLNGLTVAESEGNVSDSTPITIKPIIRDTSDPAVAGDNIMINGAGFSETATVDFIDNSSVIHSVTNYVVRTKGAIFCTIPSDLPGGSNTVKVTANSQESAAYSFTVVPPPPPTINTVYKYGTSISSGIVGEDITIDGTLFGTALGTVLIGDIAVTSYAPGGWTPASITCTIPDMGIGNYAVTVNRPDGGSVVGTSTFTVRPNIGNLNYTGRSEGVRVTIIGSYFGTRPANPADPQYGNYKVMFGGTPLSGSADVPEWAADHVTFVTPSKPVGPYQLWVQAPSAAADQIDSNPVSFNVVPSPVISEVRRFINNNHFAAPGQGMAIDGYRFGSDEGAVMIGPNPVLVGNVDWNDTLISLVIPTTTPIGIYLVTIEKPDGGYAESPNLFTVNGYIDHLENESNQVCTGGIQGDYIFIKGSGFGTEPSFEYPAYIVFLKKDSSTYALSNAATGRFNWADDSIKIKVMPQLTPGTYELWVQSPGVGGQIDSNHVNFTVVPQPTISSVYKTSTSESSSVVGDNMTITGTDFGSAQGTVLIGNTPVTSYTGAGWTDTSIQCSVPAMGIGIYTVTVDRPDGGHVVSSSTFMVRPNINSITPPSASVSFPITIGGIEFGNRPVFPDPQYLEYQVNFIPALGGPGTAIKGADLDWSPNEIKLNVPNIPAGGAVYNVKVSLPGIGGIVSSNAVSFTVLTQPTISSVYRTGTSESSSVVGDNMTIIGTNFGSAQGTVLIGNTPVTSYTGAGWTDTSIQCSVPAMGIGIYTVTVDRPDGGHVVSSSTFMVRHNINSINPPSGSVNLPIVIGGIYFGNRPAFSDPQYLEYQVNFIPALGGPGTAIKGADLDWSPNEIKLNVPNIPAGGAVYNVKVSLPGIGGIVSSNAISFTVPSSVMTITSVLNSVTSLPSGVVGDSITIIGTNFGASQGTVLIGNTPVTSYTGAGWTDTSIVCTIPNTIAGRYLVSVFDTLHTGVVSGTRFQVNGIFIRHLSANQGTAGSAITIYPVNHGANVSGQCLVKFGTSTTYITPTSWNTYGVDFIVPAGTPPGTYDIRITKDGGSISPTWSGPIRFTVISSVPFIRHLSANQGMAGSTISIYPVNHGTYNNLYCRVMFGTGNIITPTSWDTSGVVFNVPADTSSGTYDIRITKGGGIWSGPVRFTVARPFIRHLSANQGTAGSTIYIYPVNFGTYVIGQCKVKFGTDPITPDIWNALEGVAFNVPAGTLPGTYDIRITKNGGITWSGPVRFTVYDSSRGVPTPAPAITSLSPATAKAGYTIDVNGTNFGSSGSGCELSITGVSGTGQIQSSSLVTGAGGSGYSAGDFLFVVRPGGSDAKIKVSSIGAGGKVVTYVLVDAGTGYATGAATTASGRAYLGGEHSVYYTPNSTSTIFAFPIFDTLPNPLQYSASVYRITVETPFDSVNNKGGVNPAARAGDFTLSSASVSTITSVKSTATNAANGKVGDTINVVGTNFGSSGSGCELSITGVSGTGQIQSSSLVTGAGGSGYSAGDFLFVVRPGGSDAKIKVLSIGTGGTVVTYELVDAGTGYATGAATTASGRVYLGSVHGTYYTTTNGMLLSFTIPSTPPNHILPNADVYRVIVETPIGVNTVFSTNSDFKINSSVPVITSLNKTSGGGGTSVIITGTNFKVAASTVRLGSATLDPIPCTVTDSTQITFTLPYEPLPDASVYRIGVETDIGVSTATASSNFTMQ